jgi:hypothetical protein
VSRAKLRLLLSLRALPWRVARFYIRARRHAARNGDRFSLDSAARPEELAELLALARGRHVVVELGTGTGWSAIALALDDPHRRVVSYDPTVRSERLAYLKLAGPDARRRIELRAEPDTRGPHVGDSSPCSPPSPPGATRSLPALSSCSTTTRIPATPVCARRSSSCSSTGRTLVGCSSGG